MTITELQKRLQEMYEKYGDVEAFFKVENGSIIVLGAMDGYGISIKVEK